MPRPSVPPAERLRALFGTHVEPVRPVPRPVVGPGRVPGGPQVPATGDRSAPVASAWPALTESAAAAPADTSVASVLRGGLYDPSRRGAVALVGVAVVAAVVAGLVLLRGRPAEQPVDAPRVTAGTAAAGGPQLVVDVEGKVRHPGLVRVPDGSRVDDALRAAGGVLPGASTAGLNLAQKLTDGQQLLVGLAPLGGGGANASAAGLLDLNLATVDDFDGLPGIGPVLAQRIVDWRTEHGRFASVDQLQEVSGIGASKYATLKSKVRV